MKEKITIELTTEQINKIMESQRQKLPEQPKTFSIIGASKILGIGKTKMHQLINNGEINKIMIGLSPRICQSEIDKFLTFEKI